MLPLAEVLAQRGHSVRVCVPPWDDPKPSLPGFKRRNGVEILTVSLKPGPLALQLPRRLAQAALAFKPDVIHVFKPKAYSGLTALLLSLRGKPFVLDTDDWEGAGGWNDINPYSLLQKRLFAWQERALPRLAVAVTVASRTLQTQVWGFGVARDKVFYLPNGVSSTKYAGWQGSEAEEAAQRWRGKLGLEDKTVLLAYTRFAEFKAPRLLEITRRTLDLLPPAQAENTRLLVVGGGFFGEEKGLYELAERYGLGRKVIAIGQAAWEDLPGLLRCGDVALYPFDDNLINRARCSVKFLELLLAERPVVTEAVGQQSEYLHEGEGGYLVAPGDTAAFAAAASQLLQLSSESRRAFGAIAARRLYSEFSWSKLVEQAEAAYTATVRS
jgi:glycosyltransferase involved in cell wall biosynthesis